MDKINGAGRISLNTEPLPKLILKRDPEFSQRLKEAVSDVNEKQNSADEAIEMVIKGELGIHEGMMSIGKADTSLRLLGQVRNKVIAAYNEIMRMQV